MKEKSLDFLKGIFLFLLFPYVITILINGKDIALMNRSLDVEACLPGIVSLQIPDSYEVEAIKSQTIIARTNLYRKIEKGQTLIEIFKEIGQALKGTERYLFFPKVIYEEAVKETEGQVLYYEGELKLVPYHEISSGKTRNGEEVLHDEEYAYLKSVDSSFDQKSPEYLSSTYVSQQQLPQNIEIGTRDSSGYVESVLADGNVLEGEAFRMGLGLASSDFTIQKVGDEYRFLCKGRGHGLGFSQYGGNQLAKSGSSCQEILKIYFPVMEIGQITVNEFF